MCEAGTFEEKVLTEEKNACIITVLDDIIQL